MRNLSHMRRIEQLREYSYCAEKCSKETTLELFRRICINRYFELNLKKVYDTGIIKMPIYLSLGEEHIPAAYH